jgi:hypothetical protein
MLDRLRAEYGQDLLAPDGQFPLTPLTPTIRDIRPAPWAADTFKAPTGTLTVDNVSARLDRPSPTGGTLRVVRDLAIDADNHQRLQTDAIDRLIPRLRATHPTLTPRQIDFIADKFARSVHNSSAFSSSEAVRIDSLENSGLARVTVNHDTWWLLPDGRSLPFQSAPQGIDVATGRPLRLPVSNFRPELPGDPSWMLASAIHFALDVLLALVLLVAAIRTLSDAPAGARALFRFAFLKAALIVIEIVVCVGFFSSLPAPTTGRSAYATVTHSLRDFDTSRGVTGLILSVLFQSVFVVALFVTLYSFLVRRYLDALGGLYFFSPEYRLAFAHLRRKPFVKTTLRAASLLTLLVALTHLASPFVWQAKAGAHVPVALLCAIVSLLCLKWSSAPRIPDTKLAMAVIAMALITFKPASAAGQENAAKPPATQPVTPAEIAALAQKLRQSYAPERTQALSKLASLGAPAVPALLTHLQQIHLADDELQVVSTAWQKSELLATDTDSYNRALRALPDLLRNTTGRRAVTLLAAFPPTPEIAPYYARFAADHDEGARQAVAERSLEIDDAVTLLKYADVLLSQRPFERENVLDTLHRVGRPALPALARIVRSSPGDAAIAPLAAMTPGGLKDPQRNRRHNDMRARDNLGHPVDGPAPTLRKLDDPDLPAECVTACADVIVTASRSIRSTRPAAASDAQMLCRQAAYTLARGGKTGRAMLYDILVGRPVRETMISSPARTVIMRELASAFPALDGVISDARGPVPDQRWPSIANVVRAVLDDPDHAPATLAFMLSSKSPDGVRVAADVLANIGLSDPGQVEPVLEAFRSGDAQVRQLLTSAFFKSTLTDERIQTLARRIVLDPSNPQAQVQFLDRVASSGPAGRRTLIQAINDPAATPAVISKILAALSFTNPAASGLRREESKFSNPAYRDAAAEILLAYVDHPDDAFITQVALLDDPREPTRQAAAQALTSFINRSELGPVTQAKYEAILATPGARPNTQIVSAPAPPISPASIPSPATPPTLVWHVTWFLLGAVGLFLLTLALVCKTLPPLEAEILD